MLFFLFRIVLNFVRPDLVLLGRFVKHFLLGSDLCFQTGGLLRFRHPVSQPLQ